jgi:hypothetical protein
MMASDHMEPGEDDMSRSSRKRRGPTIEGTATEIAAKPITVEPPPDDTSAAPPAESPAPVSAEAPETVNAAVPPSADEAAPVTEHAQEPAPETAPESVHVSAQEPSPEPESEPVSESKPEPAPEPIAPGRPWRAIFAGAAAVGAVAGGAAYWLRPPDSTPEILARLARAEMRLTELSGRTPSIGRETINDMAARIGQIEAKIADLRPAAGSAAELPADRLQAAEKAAAAAVERTDALKRQIDADRQALAAFDQRLATAQKAQTDIARSGTSKTAEIETRLAAATSAVSELRAAIEGALKETRAALAAVAEPPALKAVRFAVAAQALDIAVARGTPYQSELAATRSLAPDAPALVPLDAFATTGLPSNDALAAEFAGLLPKLTAAAAPGPGENSILAKFTANAEKLVRVRPSGEAGGDDAGAVIARMEARVRRGDLAGALAESQKLPADAKAPIEPWAKRVEARQAARTAAQKVSAAALAAATEGKK